MLWYLLNAPADGSVSLEVLGDVAATDSSRGTIVEETKSRVGQANPIADHSIDLWKTLYNWHAAIKCGDVDPANTTFVLHTNRPFSGAIAQSFHDAQNVEQAGAAIAHARKVLLGTAKFPSAPAKGLKPYVETLFSPDARDTFEAIVARFRLESGTPIAETELFSSLRMKAIGDEVTDLVLIQLLGWLKTRTDHDIAARRPALVHARDFRIELVSLARKFDRQQILASFAPPLLPADAQQQQHLATSTYIEQLDLIESSDEDKLGAVADYLSAEADRIAWAERGLVHSSTFDQLEKELTVAWRSCRTRVTVQSADRPECDRGKLLYSDCCLHRITVQSMEPPSHFCRGSFHALGAPLGK
jgi:hypothetical protein